MLTRLPIIWSFAKWNIHLRLKFHTFMIMHFMTMSLSVKHLYQTFVINFTRQMIKKTQLNSSVPLTASTWRNIRFRQFIINEIACSPFESRKLRRLICHGILMSFLYLGMPSFRKLRYYFFSRQTEFDKHHTHVYTEQLPNGLSHL